MRITLPSALGWPIAAALMIVLLSACGAVPIGPPGPDGRPLTWVEMSLDQRKAHMRKEVVPLAADIFGNWRPYRYATVECSLCHGPDASAGRFRMPTPHLPRLSGELLLGPEFEKYPDTTRLKLDQLVPRMAAALGKKPFSILTRRGFGCYSCHLGPEGPMFGN